MSKMIVFETTASFKGIEVNKVFVVGHVPEDERLFPVNFAEAEFLEKDDMIVHIGAFTMIKRHTDAGFVVKHFHAGDEVVLTARGDWRVRHSLRSYMALAWKKMRLWYENVVFRLECAVSKRNELGTIKRQIEQNFCCIECRCR